MEQTLSIIKPDGVKKQIIGDVIRRFENRGLSVKAMRMLQMTKEDAMGFYAVHKERPFFDSLTDFMCSGPVVVMVLEGEKAIALNREIMGATNFKEADEGTIRKDFASSIESNVVHGSDAPETAKTEIAYFFSSLDIMA
ncbi:nucleoside-diphosphate kinase [Desulfoluna spongiiphila]|uniref:Nucleoside diphosphate kinase n=1 Tax=Desulfoluna spongiiphila TaxID=419481 RepID=A0A1G5DC72_9BACT|nr:nucleoside-diphosphate kinase [Desulfoluna spongiiphila]SCY12147.1 nucleoside diphosphate kinase [Desulfoluna spongiiphila]